MKKIYKILSYVLILTFFVMAMSGCGKKKDIPKVKISLWTDEETTELMNGILTSFQEKYKDEVELEYVVSFEGADTCKDTVLSNPKGAADLFIFPDDQLDEMKNAGVLLEITDNKDKIIEGVGGADSSAAQTALRDGKLYAYPYSAGNGYFLYYNKAYFSENDVSTMKQILEVCRKNGKKFSMDFSSGWYIYSFFKGAGLEMAANEEKTQNVCNWNATDTKYKGVDVAQAMLDIATDDGFLHLEDTPLVEAVKSGEVIACVNGPWNANNFMEAWGDGFAATKLPTYTVCGNEEQMCSFIGYKLVGINANTKNPEWTMKLAEYIANADNQLKMFRNTGECPANIEAAANDEVQASPVISATAEQIPYADMQSVISPFWDASKKFGVTILSGNPDGKDLQELLDIAVEGITALE